MKKNNRLALTLIALAVLVLAIGAWYTFGRNNAPAGVPSPVTGKPCGGNMRNAPGCDAGYHCAPVPGSHLPFGDVGGFCVAD